MQVTLSNSELTVVVDSKGAELQSIKGNRTCHQYLWQGDQRFWGRRSPVLFPIVGSLANGVFQMDGEEYAMGQHGFARDCEFDIMEGCGDDEVWFILRSSEETLKRFPRRFALKIGYKLVDERLMVKWVVENHDDKDLCFQIGAHPAFNYPDFNSSDEIHGYFNIDGGSLKSQIIAEKGCVGDRMVDVERDRDGMLPLTSETFKHDALIFADGQVRRVSMLDKERRPYLTLFFNAPVVGLWSPVAGDAPFVCIEPWWGRCDRLGFSGDFSLREFVNCLAPGEKFDAGYMILIDNL